MGAVSYTSDPEPTEDHMDVVRGLMEEYGSEGVFLMVAAQMTSEGDDWRAHLRHMCAVTDTKLRWPDLHSKCTPRDC